jgi:hypothetical protein
MKVTRFELVMIMAAIRVNLQVKYGEEAANAMCKMAASSEYPMAALLAQSGIMPSKVFPETTVLNGHECVAVKFYPERGFLIAETIVDDQEKQCKVSLDDWIHACYGDDAPEPNYGGVPEHTKYESEHLPSVFDPMAMPGPKKAQQKKPVSFRNPNAIAEEVYRTAEKAKEAQNQFNKRGKDSNNEPVI